MLRRRHAREKTEAKIFIAINKHLSYTLFTGKGIKFYQWQGNAPNGAIIMHLRSKKRGQKKANPAPKPNCYRIIISFSTP
jgi:hypothetical protein